MPHSFPTRTEQLVDYLESGRNPGTYCDLKQALVPAEDLPLSYYHKEFPAWIELPCSPDDLPPEALDYYCRVSKAKVLPHRVVTIECKEQPLRSFQIRRGSRVTDVIIKYPAQTAEPTPIDPQIAWGRKGAEGTWASHRNEWPKWQEQIDDFMDRNPDMHYSDACRSVARDNKRSAKTIERRTSNSRTTAKGQ